MNGGEDRGERDRLGLMKACARAGPQAAAKAKISQIKPNEGSKSREEGQGPTPRRDILSAELGVLRGGPYVSDS